MELRLKPNRSIFELTGKKRYPVRVRGFAKSNFVKERILTALGGYLVLSSLHGVCCPDRAVTVIRI